jgi:hypothetical protein
VFRQKILENFRNLKINENFINILRSKLIWLLLFNQYEYTVVNAKRKCSMETEMKTKKKNNRNLGFYGFQKYLGFHLFRD